MRPGAPPVEEGPPGSAEREGSRVASAGVVWSGRPRGRCLRWNKGPSGPKGPRPAPDPPRHGPGRGRSVRPLPCDSVQPTSVTSGSGDPSRVPTRDFVSPTVSESLPGFRRRRTRWYQGLVRRGEGGGWLGPLASDPRYTVCTVSRASWRLSEAPTRGPGRFLVSHSFYTKMDVVGHGNDQGSMSGGPAAQSGSRRPSGNVCATTRGTSGRSFHGGFCDSRPLPTREEWERQGHLAHTSRPSQ